MIRLSAVLCKPDEHYGLLADEPSHWCPGCNTLHTFNVSKRNYSGAIWTWDGNVDKPTFSPSMNIRIGPYDANSDDPEDREIEVCHYFLRYGIIEYLGDCTHNFKGKHVALPPIPALWPIYVKKG